MRLCASKSFSTGSIFDDKLKKHAVKTITKKNEYQTIFIVYSSKGQQKMYKSVQSQTLSPFQPYELQWEGKRS